MTFLGNDLWISQQNLFNPEGFLIVFRAKSSILIILRSKFSEQNQTSGESFNEVWQKLDTKIVSPGRAYYIALQAVSYSTKERMQCDDEFFLNSLASGPCKFAWSTCFSKKSCSKLDRTIKWSVKTPGQLFNAHLSSRCASNSEYGMCLKIARQMSKKYQKMAPLNFEVGC